MANDALEANGTTIYLEDYTIDGTRYGINSTNSTLNMSDVDISNSSVTGIRTIDTDTTADSITITDAGTNGFGISGGTLLLSNAIVDGSTDAGLYGSNAADITVDSSVFQNGTHGLELEGSETSLVTFAITNSNFDLNSDSGVSLTYADGSFDSSIANNNQNLGMECSNATFTSCAGNDLASNLNGEQIGCDATCGTDASSTN